MGNNFETTFTEGTGANFNNHVLRMITDDAKENPILSELFTTLDFRGLGFFIID